MGSLAKRIGFTAATVFLCLGVAELALQAADDGTPALVSPLAYQRYSGSAFTPGREPGTRVYVSGRRRIVTNQKAGVRILVFGASAAYGEMFSPFTAFAGVSERLLRVANPDTPIEVVNLAHGGMGSRQVGEMAHRALENDDVDAIVVYTGNNEYHELRALKARSKTYDPQAELLRRRLSTSALYRRLRDSILPTDSTLTPPEGESWLPIGRLDVTVDDADRDLGVVLYREHLESIANAARRRNVPLILATVGTNLRDHIDRGTPGQPSAEEQRALSDLQTIAGTAAPERFATEGAARRDAITTEGGLHTLGQLYLRAGLLPEATDAFEQKELAALRPMTSNRRLRDVIEEAPSAWNAVVCDLAAALAAGAQHGVPGNDVFIDHCHPNAQGHALLGQALAQCIEQLELTGLDGAVSTAETLVPDPYRVDHYSGHRPIPGFKTNPIPADRSTLDGLVLAGHQAFVTERYADALKAYEAVAVDPSAPSSIHVSIGLTHLYLQNLAAAQDALREAKNQGVRDAHRILETLNP